MSVMSETGPDILIIADQRRVYTLHKKTNREKPENSSNYCSLIKKKKNVSLLFVCTLLH